MTNLNSSIETTKGSHGSSNHLPKCPKTLRAFELFSRVFQTYSPNEVFVSFNGGKDCTVVLHLLHRFMQTNEAFKDIVIPAMYIRPKYPFPEVEKFVQDCAKTYPLQLLKEEGCLKTALKRILEKNTNLKVVLMGVRRTDPFCGNMKPMQPTDPDWPPLMRVNPILDWSCHDVWEYLRANKVPYCPLYNEGYTSLGETTNTFKNKDLEMYDAVTGEIKYRPAYELLDDSLERQGRFV